jgi:hypothetical protein
MNLENVQRISAASESACIAVLQKPGDAGARKRLFLTLSDLIDPAFQGEEADSYYSNQLILEVHLWADMVRTRIQLAQDRTTLKPTLRITYSVQQLLLMLSDLARQCSRTGIALRLLDPQVPRSANGPLRSDAAFRGRQTGSICSRRWSLAGASPARWASCGLIHLGSRDVVATGLRLVVARGLFGNNVRETQAAC